MAEVDDGSIANEADLLRRIHPKQVIIDDNTGQLRPTSAAFRDQSMSVDVAPILAAQGLDFQFTLASYPGYGLVKFQAGVARKQDLAVVPKPILEPPENPAHAEVVGKKTGAVINALKAASEWVRQPAQAG